MGVVGLPKSAFDRRPQIATVISTGHELNPWQSPLLFLSLLPPPPPPTHTHTYIHHCHLVSALLLSSPALPFSALQLPPPPPPFVPLSSALFTTPPPCLHPPSPCLLSSSAPHFAPLSLLFSSSAPRPPPPFGPLLTALPLSSLVRSLYLVEMTKYRSEAGTSVCFRTVTILCPCGNDKYDYVRRGHISVFPYCHYTLSLWK